jgi:Spy/CpxP family protein refolding chaperone
MFTNIKRMTIVPVLIIGIAMLFSTVMQAQPQRLSVEERVKILKDSLKLSDEQTTKVTKILEDQREEMTTAMNNNRGDRQAMRAVRQEIMKKTDDKIKEVLTEEQVKVYDKVIKNRQAQMSRRMNSSKQ